MKKLIVPALAVLLAVAVPAVAHHSFPATYDVTRTISIKGKVTRFMFRNPHSLVMVDVATAAGALARAGASRDSLKVGDEIAIVGNPGRSTTEHRIRLNSIKRASDGWGWSGEFE